MTELSSSNQKSHFDPKHLVKKRVKSTQLEEQQSENALEKISELSSSEVNLDSINLFNPPKSNPNGRLAAAKLFDRDKGSSLVLKDKWVAVSPCGTPSDRNTPNGEDTGARSGDVEKDFTVNLPKNLAEELNFWRIGAISLILLVNILSAFTIFKDKFFKPIGKQEVQSTPEILAGKTNLAAQEFITPNLNSLSSISTAVKGNSIMESDVKSKVSLPLAIPPTNLPNKGIISSSVKNIPYYYILVEYTGEESLQLAQEQVKNVSLVNFPQGIFIYLGAFSEKASGEKFLNKIKETGLNGYIYHSD